MSYDPPPFPETEDDQDATSFVSLEELAPADHLVEPERTSTNTRFGMPAARDDSSTGPASQRRQRELDAQRREPAPAQRRPTLFGSELAAGTAGPKTVRPGVLAPVRPRTDSHKPDVGAHALESSDVISTFSADASQPAVPQPVAPRSRPRLERRPPRPAGAPQAARPAPPPPTMHALGSTLTTLPLDHEQLMAMIGNQRRRMRILFAWARALEVGAGVLGTLSLAVLVTAVVGSLLATTPALLPGAAALIGAASGVGIALMMVVGAVALRQLTHLSAQHAALLEALCTTRGPHQR
ncbi:MAG: hypothetical protein RIT45_599 [Pseudomonadota bacterium]|jgi:hypothetical protein